jgi:Aminopeptidase N
MTFTSQSHGEQTESVQFPFDILHYSMDIDIYNNFVSPYPKNFNGNLKITFVADSVINSINLDAQNASLQIDSVKLAGTSFTHNSNVLKITLDRTYNPGDTAEVLIYYMHKNVSDKGFYVSGGTVFSDCEPEGARHWYPCRDKPADKATFEVKARTPVNVKLGSIGTLVDSTNTGQEIFYHWVSRDPVATYLFVIAGRVNYQLKMFDWIDPVTHDTIPVRLYANPNENLSQSLVETVTQQMEGFTAKFGSYPFEKHGFATLNSQFAWGGMENQTLTTLCTNCWAGYLLAHEFAHQWFGDMISPTTWADIFLNEGFADFSEALWEEIKMGGDISYFNSTIQDEADYYLSFNPGWPIYNPEWAVVTPGTNTLFNTAITYSKGGCVLAMARYMMGSDEFFNAIRSYTSDPRFRYKTCSIPEFIDKMSEAYGQDLHWFFEQWLYQPNHPVYANTYSIRSAQPGEWTVDFTAKQTQTNTGFFKMPLELKINFSDASDTLVSVFNDENNQVFSFNFTKQPVSLRFDPNTKILLKQGSTVVSVEDEDLCQRISVYSRICRTLSTRKL